MKIVAEIGTAHGGNLNKAKEFINVAKDCGADCVKFQIVYADEILHPKSGIVPLPSGNIPLYDVFKDLEVSTDFYLNLKNYADEKKIEFSASPFGIKSLYELLELNPSFIKIASPELNHFPLIKELNNIRENYKALEKKLDVVLSTGVSKIKDIEKSLSWFNDLDGISLLHCITCYPAPIDEYNIRVIKTLKDKLMVPVGVSDHSTDPLIVPLLTLALDGFMIEKHIALSNEDDGLDDKVALNPYNFTKMCKYIREYENKTDSILDFLYNEYGKEKIDLALGDGVKKLSKSEEANYERTNRSIHFMNDMKKGDIIQQEDISVLRTEKVLTPGISSEFYYDIIGKKLKMDVEAGEGLKDYHFR